VVVSGPVQVHEAAVPHPFRRTLLLLLMPLVLAACQDSPADFPRRLELALASGSPQQVEPLLTQASRPLFRAMVASAGNGKGPFHLRATKTPVQVEGVQTGEAGIVVSVRAGGPVREWVLVHEDGALRLDLMATSARRPWSM
jgi:hypothetical protein